MNEKNVIGLYFSEDSQEAKPADRTIRIDVLEQNLMLYARQLLFILLIKEEALSAEEKAKFILEVTGNIMVRPKTAKRVRMLLRYLRMRLRKLLVEMFDRFFLEYVFLLLASLLISVVTRLVARPAIQTA